MSIEHWQDRFSAFAQRRSEADPEWLRSLRAESMALFEAQGIPTTRMEEWRYTNLDALGRIDFETGGEAQAASFAPAAVRQAAERASAGDTAARLVFVDGHLAEELSSFSGVAVQALAVLRQRDPGALEGRLGRLAEPKRHAFAALNTAFLDDGAVVRVADGEYISRPIHLVFLASPLATRAQHPRVLIEMGVGSQAQVVQDHICVNDSEGLTNSVIEIDARENASLDFILLQRESDAHFHISNTVARIGRDAHLATHTVTLGGRLVRNDLTVRFGGEGSDCTMNGLFVVGGESLVDNHTQVDHATPHGTSRELYKGVLDAKSRGIFRGRVIVAPDAQKTDARQRNPNLLLGAGAEMDSRPQLEIHANDVKCSHGTSIGRLEEEALFYLRSRGIEREEASALLTLGFANEILEALPVDPLKAALSRELRTRLFGSEVLA